MWQCNRLLELHIELIVARTHSVIITRWYARNVLNLIFPLMSQPLGTVILFTLHQFGYGEILIFPIYLYSIFFFSSRKFKIAKKRQTSFTSSLLFCGNIIKFTWKILFGYRIILNSNVCTLQFIITKQKLEYLVYDLTLIFTKNILDNLMMSWNKPINKYSFKQKYMFHAFKISIVIYNHNFVTMRHINKFYFIFCYFHENHLNVELGISFSSIKVKYTSRALRKNWIIRWFT